jgi:metallophosphoesterase (TIGR00282 family)
VEQPARLLFWGDVVGDEALTRLEQRIPILRKDLGLLAVVVNGENAAGGSGLTAAQFHRLRKAGVDVVTLGDHGLKRREIVPLLERGEPISRPANLPSQAPGRGWAQTELAGGVVLRVVTVLGRVFMKPVDCPFDALDRVLAEMGPGPGITLVDLHAEATAEKELLGWHVDGKVAAAVGTHTHVPTADERVLPGGTAYQTDVGMCGSMAGVLGRDPAAVLRTTRTGLPESWSLTGGRIALSGALIEVDVATGRALGISRFREEGPG